MGSDPEFLTSLGISIGIILTPYVTGYASTGAGAITSIVTMLSGFIGC